MVHHHSRQKRNLLCQNASPAFSLALLLLAQKGFLPLPRVNTEVGPL